ncbi:Origin recognition complex subunit 6, partial [Sciurus carolinensis]|nr:Origin recognition complex subunit 6 [Sciurus carolinensis]
KAEEYLRLSQVKCIGLSAHITETSNAVMCLDLAASWMKCPLDRTQQVDLDLSRSLFTTAALLTACKILKLKVDKNKMAATSGVKKAIFDRLCKQLEKIGQQIDKREPGNLSSPPQKKKKIVVEPPVKELEKVVEIPHTSQKDEDLTQDYEEWKRKILENAANAQKTTAE